MSDAANIEGLPQQPGRYEPKSEVDTDKFKRMMKIDESDEAQKRHKRSRTKQEEEEEEEKVEDEKSPHIAFSELMGKQKKGESIFDIEGGVEALLESEEQGAVTATKGVTTPIPAPPLKTEEERKEKEEKEQRRAKKIETEAAAAAAREQKEKEEIKRLELPPTPLAPTLTPALAPTEEDITAKLQEEETLPSTPIPVETKEEKPPAPFPTIEEEKLSLSSLKKKPEEEKKKETYAPPPSPTPIFAPTSLEHLPAPSYTALSSEVFDLFERLIGLMTIEQTKGVSTTTVTLNMPGSVFNGSQIVLEHYSTAPGAFNLELRGSPEAMQIFADNLSELASAFQGSRLAFTVHLRTPTLLEEHRPLIRRKEKPGEKKSRE